MTAALGRRSLASLFSKNSSFLCKSPVYFSTDGGKQHLEPRAISEFLTHKHHFSPESASQVAARLKTLDKADSVLSFLRETGLSTTQLEQTVRLLPIVLSSKLETTIKPKIKIFQEFGFTPDQISLVISKNPIVLYYSRLIPSLSVLKGLLGSTEEVAKVLMRISGGFLNRLEKNLLPNVEIMKSCGVPMKQIVRSLTIPRFLLHKPEMMRKFVQRVDDMGFDRRSGNYIYAVRTVSSMSNETWDLKLKTLRELGFSEDDILRVFRYSPHVFTVSEKKMKQVAQVLLETGKYNISCFVNSPTVFMYSINKRHRPRLQVLRILEKKNLITEWPSLGTLHKITNDVFFERFVAPYSDEVGEVWNDAGSGNEEVN